MSCGRWDIPQRHYKAPPPLFPMNHKDIDPELASFPFASAGQEIKSVKMSGYPLNGSFVAVPLGKKLFLSSQIQQQFRMRVAKKVTDSFEE